MSSFRRVDASVAGSSALGILVPPGRRTLVILRPRGLEWDLLPARWNGEPSSPPAFCTFDREEAALVARQAYQSLESAARIGGGALETFGDRAGSELQLWARIGDLVWIVCRRRAGQSYQPAIFTSSAEAERSALLIEPYLRPPAGEAREVYFNTQQFSR
jgi:hypothetical protein